MLNMADSMFSSCGELTSFSGDLPMLNDGHYMFESCGMLTSFSGDMPSLSRGERMFMYCYELTSFSGDLSSLDNGEYMFSECKLDLESVQRIADSLPSYDSGSHPITIGVDSFEVTQGQQDEANTTIVTKGWTVTWQRN